MVRSLVEKEWKRSSRQSGRLKTALEKEGAKTVWAGERRGQVRKDVDLC